MNSGGARGARRALLVIVAALWSAAPVHAEIFITPLRQVLFREAPVATYEVSNPSNRLVDGRVSWIDLVAMEQGYSPAAPADRTRMSAAPYLTVEPAWFRLQPGARTTITVRLKNGDVIPHGERRSHLLIETGALRTPLRKAGGGLEVDVDLGVSTPVILRGGPLVAPKVAFGPTKLLRRPDGGLELETTLVRTGRYSSFGKITATMRINGEEQPLSIVDNIAVYTDGAPRRLALAMPFDELPPGVLKLRYVGGGEYSGRLFAEKSFEISAPD